MTLRPISDLRPYQRATALRVVKEKRLLLAMDMGLGKTVTVLTAVAYLKKIEEVKKTIVVAPLKVARETWAQEVEQWAHLQGLTTSRILGDVKQREKALALNADIEIINRENLPWLYDWMVANRCVGRYDMMIWDESSSLKEARKRTKTSNASRFGIAARLSETCSRVILLSGTPVPEGIEGIWGQMYILDGGHRLGKYKTHFFSRWFNNVSRSPQFPMWQLRPGAFEEIVRAVDDLVVKLDSAALLTLPERIDITVPVELPKPVMDQYKQLKKDYGIILDEATVLAPNAAVLVGKLAQVASGTLIDSDKKVHEVHRAKIDALKEMLGETNENVLVWYNFVEDLNRLKAAFPEAVSINDKGAVEAWNAGKIKVLLAHPQSAGHGLNLQHGGSVSVWFTVPWSLEQYMQANKRLHRSGQQAMSVRIYHLLSKGTVDELIYAALLEKAKDAAAFTETPETIKQTLIASLEPAREPLFKRHRL